MPYIIEVIDNDGDSAGYLEKVDFEANAPHYPTGDAKATKDPKQAIIFDSVADAFYFISTRSKQCPTRPDGKPNRPLRALNLNVVDMPSMKN